jgi:threonine/homoserine/homoserine lactone efflux protein
LIAYTFIGIMLGLAAGISPGPLLALVIAETIRHGYSAGFKVAAAPLLTDLPIILLSYFVIQRFSNMNIVLALISISGALFIAYLGAESLRINKIDLDVTKQKMTSLGKGVLANATNPQPYLFWITVGAPTAIKAAHANLICAIGFIAGFYLLLVGSKLLVALAVQKSKKFITGRGFLIINRILGACLFLFALLLLFDGIRTLFGEAF